MWRRLAYCGPAADYLKEIRVDVDGVFGQGPTGTCVREDRPVVNDDFDTNPATLPWREAAMSHGFRLERMLPPAPPGQSRRRADDLRQPAP